jgi:hypothetical protein
VLKRTQFTLSELTAYAVLGTNSESLQSEHFGISAFLVKRSLP